MKRVLVFLMILAAAGGGAFAESGEFSWSGSVEVGIAIDFGLEDDADNMTIGPDADGNIRANVDLEYTRGALTLGMGFEAVHHDEDDGLVRSASIGLSALYETDRWGAFVALDLFNRGITTSTLNRGPNYLWGYYLFMDGDFRIDVSFAGGGNGLWAVSDIAIGAVEDRLEMEGFLFDRLGFDELGLEGRGLQFTYTGIEGLSLGAIVPVPMGGDRAFGGYSIQNMVLGAAYEMDGLGLSFMLGLLSHEYLPFPIFGDDGVDIAVHLGFSYALSEEMSISADVLAYIASDENTFFNNDVLDRDESFFMALGLGFNFEEGPLSFEVTAHVFDLTNAFDMMFLTLEPSVTFEIDEDLTASLGIVLGLGLGDAVDGLFEINPGLEIRVAPNAAINLGLSFAYDFGSEDSSLGFTAGFKWSF